MRAAASLHVPRALPGDTQCGAPPGQGHPLSGASRRSSSGRFVVQFRGWCRLREMGTSQVGKEEAQLHEMCPSGSCCLLRVLPFQCLLFQLATRSPSQLPRGETRQFGNQLSSIDGPTASACWFAPPRAFCVEGSIPRRIHLWVDTPRALLAG